MKELKRLTSDNILIPKPLIDPYSLLRQLNETKKDINRKYLRIFNKRSGRNEYTLNLGTNKYLVRDPKYIHVIDYEQAIQLLFKMNNLIKESNFLDFEISYEDCDTDQTE